MTTPVSRKKISCVLAVIGVMTCGAEGGAASPAKAEIHVLEAGSRTGRVAGVSPSIAEVVADVRRSQPASRVLLSSPAALSAALEQAVSGKNGPILVVVDGNKIRVMELKKK